MGARDPVGFPAGPLGVLLLLPLLLAGAACGGAASAHADPAGQLTGASAACRAADLHAMFRGFRAAGGSLTGAVVLTSAGAAPCMLAGTPPSVSLLDTAGGTVSVRSHALAVPEDAGPVELKPGATMPAFGAAVPAGSTWFVVTWSNWCSDAVPGVTSLLVVLPAGGTVVAQPDPTAPAWAPSPGAPHCDDGRVGSTVTIGRFQTPGVPSPANR
jgi:hypothetical protein